MTKAKETLDVAERVLDAALQYASRNEGFTREELNDALAAAGLPSIEEAQSALASGGISQAQQDAMLERLRGFLERGGGGLREFNRTH